MGSICSGAALHGLACGRYVVREGTDAAVRMYRSCLPPSFCDHMVRQATICCERASVPRQSISSRKPGDPIINRMGSLH